MATKDAADQADFDIASKLIFGADVVAAKVQRKVLLKLKLTLPMAR
jgi:hypothetical protein